MNTDNSSALLQHVKALTGPYLNLQGTVEEVVKHLEVHSAVLHPVVAHADLDANLQHCWLLECFVLRFVLREPLHHQQVQAT
jgi:hypothetical protein